MLGFATAVKFEGYVTKIAKGHNSDMGGLIFTDFGILQLFLPSLGFKSNFKRSKTKFNLYIVYITKNQYPLKKILVIINFIAVIMRFLFVLLNSSLLFIVINNYMMRGNIFLHVLHVYVPC